MVQDRAQHSQDEEMAIATKTINSCTSARGLDTLTRTPRHTNTHSTLRLVSDNGMVPIFHRERGWRGWDGGVWGAHRERGWRGVDWGWGGVGSKKPRCCLQRRRVPDCGLSGCCTAGRSAYANGVHAAGAHPASASANTHNVAFGSGRMLPTPHLPPHPSPAMSLSPFGCGQLSNILSFQRRDSLSARYATRYN